MLHTYSSEFFASFTIMRKIYKQFKDESFSILEETLIYRNFNLQHPIPINMVSAALRVRGAVFGRSAEVPKSATLPIRN